MWLVKVQRDPWELNEKLFVVRKQFGRDIYEVVVSLTLEQATAGAISTDKPMLAGVAGFESNDVREFLQACVDEAWSLGMRPKNFEAASQELKAVRDHLQDMRRLAKVVE